MSNIKLVSLDLDGTTLNWEKNLSAATKSALRRAVDAGVKVVLNTGRPWVSTVSFLDELGLTHDFDRVIVNNGGQISDGRGKILEEIVLSYADIGAIYEQAQRFDLPMDIITGDTSYTVEFARKSQVHYINNTLTFKPIDFARLPQEVMFNKVVLSAEPAVLDAAISALILPQFERVKTRDMLLEIMPKGVNKASGLAKLCELLGVAPENVLAMGDEGNDVAMLAWAGLGVAPANAISEAKEAADIVSKLTCDENAVAKIIEEYVLR
ncbi:MAG: Cof-type HAD-IIB family hydrolase [Streptococcaceae bacterium]|jgi:Cof subfamily protein (haloacid dehalogenase superfamily)|nr:Cof-type HAD-IIB family hydrolase [Streptococcaceae bacterium]